ncbi:hypothetical protein BDP81DRAFT_51664 [Colletotrichum phormii]|uniref:Uncharacterized protein n=1 Tax=Colletotrichum phormii TaxID=359342 RepID=A0AAJ0EF39_9PEZI|nr:uncharacterized protein BDP81DRAFT_51664 [Colletotrichum phormii]KAK1634706.1 hypothetical protein BDP81DRAFT_51664 [Colletotrichum phormii]
METMRDSPHPNLAPGRRSRASIVLRIPSATLGVPFLEYDATALAKRSSTAAPFSVRAIRISVFAKGTLAVQLGQNTKNSYETRPLTMRRLTWPCIVTKSREHRYNFPADVKAVAPREKPCLVSSRVAPCLGLNFRRIVILELVCAAAVLGCPTPGPLQGDEHHLPRYHRAPSASHCS